MHGRFIQHLSSTAEPLRALMSQGTVCLVLGRASKKIVCKSEKALICKAPILAVYDPNRETRVTAGASSVGLDAVLEQRQQERNWRPGVYASRTLSETEKRYAQLEEETLAATWACERFSQYLLGKQLMLITDYKPFVPLLGNKNLEELSPRIQTMRMRLMRYKYSIEHVSGKELGTADTLSRSPVDATTAKGDTLQQESEH